MGNEGARRQLDAGQFTASCARQSHTERLRRHSSAKLGMQWVKNLRNGEGSLVWQVLASEYMAQIWLVWGVLGKSRTSANHVKKMTVDACCSFRLRCEQRFGYRGTAIDVLLKLEQDVEIALHDRCRFVKRTRCQQIRDSIYMLNRCYADMQKRW